MSNLSNFVQQVVVVGGGTAGWLTALHIKSALESLVDVTLVESPNVPIIGVGEGTTTTLRNHLQTLNISEDDFLRGCGASFKNGIRFENWCGGTGPSHYIHPFFSGESDEHESPIWAPHVWMRLKLEGLPSLPALPLSCWPESWLMEKKRAPVAFENGQRNPNQQVSYAYHLDSAQFGVFLRDVAVKRGVRHIVDDVVAVEKSSEVGDIQLVRTSSGRRVAGEFFIDCTGFHRVLMREFGDSFVDFDQHLLNDRAITTRIPYPGGHPVGIPSCTISRAMKYGWMWEIPLFSRMGAGYVYSSQFVSDEDAEAEFRVQLGLPDIETRVIRFRSGYVREAWSRNCVGIGLSGGFMEPLEATGIAMITHAIFRLLENWPDRDFAPSLRDLFNEDMRSSYEWIRDFLVMHFCFSRRDDTAYWNRVRHPDCVPETLTEQMRLWDERWPFGAMLEPQRGYRVLQSSLYCVLAGFERFPRATNAYVEGLNRDHMKAIMNQSSNRIRQVIARCPDHATYLNVLNGVGSESSPTKTSVKTFSSH